MIPTLHHNIQLTQEFKVFIFFVKNSVSPTSLSYLSTETSRAINLK